MARRTSTPTGSGPPFAPLLALLGAVLTFGAAAQEARDRDAAPAVAACGAIADDAARLRCYDAAAGGAEPSPPSAEPAPAESAPRSAERAPAESPPPRAEQPPPAELPSAASPPPPDGPPAAARAAARERFGLPSPADAPDTIAVVVVEIEETISGTARFTTEDGQVWEQTSSRTRPYPDLPFGARIESAASNSYFLRPASGGAAVRVRRVR